MQHNGRFSSSVPAWNWTWAELPKATPSTASVELLKEQHIERAFVSAGGSTLYGLGAPPDTPGWEVKVQDPLAPHDPKKSATTVVLNNKCLSVSGNYEKFFKVRGVTYSHIMDPRTGRPVENMLSVAVSLRTAPTVMRSTTRFTFRAWRKERLYFLCIRESRCFSFCLTVTKHGKWCVWVATIE